MEALEAAKFFNRARKSRKEKLTKINRTPARYPEFSVIGTIL